MPPDQTQKFRKLFIAMLVLAIVFFLGSGTLGYLYYQKYQSYKNLTSEKKLVDDKLTALNAGLATTQGTSTKQITDLQKEVTDLKTTNTAQTQKMAKALTYNNFFIYLIEIIQAHNGLEGWTEAEYQSGRTIALKTKDNDFVALLDWAWNNRDGNQIERLTRVLRSIADNIGNNVK